MSNNVVDVVVQHQQQQSANTTSTTRNYSLLLTDTAILTELNDWWNRSPKEGTNNTIDYETYCALYEKIYFHLVPPSQWKTNLDELVKEQWDTDRGHNNNNNNNGQTASTFGKSSLGKQDFLMSMVRLVCNFAGNNTGSGVKAAELLPYFKTTRQVIVELFPDSTATTAGVRKSLGILSESLPGIGTTTTGVTSSRSNADKWKNIESMLERIEQKKYEHTHRKVKKVSGKKHSTVVYPPPANPLCPNNSWCGEYYDKEHNTKFSHHCRLY
eukprot:PhF_6_TR5530/c0_g1_i1/m.7854